MREENGFEKNENESEDGVVEHFQRAGQQEQLACDFSAACEIEKKIVREENEMFSTKYNISALKP